MHGAGGAPDEERGEIAGIGLPGVRAGELRQPYGCDLVGMLDLDRLQRIGQREELCRQLPRSCPSFTDGAANRISKGRVGTPVGRSMWTPSGTSRPLVHKTYYALT